MLLCEDARFEIGGMVTLVGVHNERIVVRRPADAADDEPLVLPRLAFVAVIAGLRGVEQIAFRHRLARVGDRPREMAAMAFEPHDPAADEHNFVVSEAPMLFPEPGRYEVALDLDARGELVTYTYQFELVVRPAA